ncbi:MAG: hypothetical protein AB1941_00060 [Gemmatimonadota bacterium]
MNDRIYISIPFTNLLKTEAGWTRDPNEPHKYYLLRFHFMLRERQLDEPIRKGQVVDAFTPNERLSHKKIMETEFEHTTIKLRVRN